MVKKNIYINMKNLQRHTYHMVEPSPWPLLGGMAGFTLMTGAVMYFHSFEGGKITLLLGVYLILFTMFVWWRDIIRESTFQGHHTKIVQTGLRYGMALFIVSEIMFFFGFFWAYFHASLAPTVELGSIWPPKAIVPFNLWDVPLLNTIILLSSGATVTWAHHAMVSGDRNQANYSLALTILLAVLFTGLQGYEYVVASFNISDSVYGSAFYMATGFHGLHVIIGTTFLMVCFFRLVKFHFTTEHHFGFEAAAWYWHFVDIVWLILFVSIYWWGSL